MQQHTAVPVGTETPQLAARLADLRRTLVRVEKLRVATDPNSAMWEFYFYATTGLQKEIKFCETGAA